MACGMALSKHSVLEPVAELVSTQQNISWLCTGTSSTVLEEKTRLVRHRVKKLRVEAVVCTGAITQYFHQVTNGHTCRGLEQNSHQRWFD